MLDREGILSEKLSTNMSFQDLTTKDFGIFEDMVNLYFLQGSSLLRPLLTLSIAGHAQNGHGAYEKSFPNAHVTDVMEVLRKTNYLDCDKKTKIRVSKEIDRTKDFLEALVEESLDPSKNVGSRLRHPSNNKIHVESLDQSEPLFDLLEFSRKKYNIKDPLAFLSGAVIAAFMDSVKYRKMTLDRFNFQNFEGGPFNLAYGNCVVGNKKILNELNINLDFFLDLDLPDFMKIACYDEGGLVRINKYRYHNSPDYNSDHINIYSKENDGAGICDDAALIWIGKYFTQKMGVSAGIDAFFGAMLIDVVDTFDKINAFPITGGTDEYFGRMINYGIKEKTGKKLVSDNEIMDTIYFAAKNNFPRIKFSDGVRRFQQLQRLKKSSNRYNRGSHFTPIQSHLKYINNGEKIDNLLFGFNLTPSLEFYDILDHRFNYMKSLDILK